MKVKVCVIQDSPEFFDKEATKVKVSELVATFSEQGCDLIVFPESFIPGYPRGFNFGTKIGSRSPKGRDQYAQYHRNSFLFKGDDKDWLEKLAKDHNIYIVLGVTEKQEEHGSLFCSVAYVSPKNGLMGVHRKIKPTAAERVVWAEADGTSLLTFSTSIGILGGLICWENYMPLARMSMYRKGVQIYIAPTADSRPSWVQTLQTIAREGRCFVLGSNQYFTRSMYPPEFRQETDDLPEEICPGGSVIISPMGDIIQGPLFSESGALVAEIDLEEIVKSKLDFDPAGHYSRDDIFEFNVKGQPETKNEND